MCSNESYQKLESFINALPPNGESNLIEVLHHAQEIFGYLPREVQEFVAKTMGIPVAKVYGVITFYTYFKTEPIGKYEINVCMGTGCFVKGAQTIMEQLEQILGIKSGQTTSDNMFTLTDVRCIGACGLAPVILVNDKVYGHVKVEELKGIIADYVAQTEVA